MAARRLIMILLVLLFISSLAAALIPIDRSDDSTDSSTTSTTAAAEAPPAGRSLVKRIDVRQRKPETIRMKVGDQLELSVDGPVPDQVEIPRLDLVEPIDSGAPARFDLLADMPGTYPVRLVEANKLIGRLVVTVPEPAKQKQTGKRRPSGSGRKA